MAEVVKTKVKINLDTLIAKCVHRPLASGDDSMIPLYSRNDGLFDTGYVGEGNGDISRSERWIKTSERFYNSPNNVKRIFITYKGVTIHLFKPIFGDSNKNLSKFYSFKSVGVDSESLLNELKGRIGGNPANLDITRTGLNAIKKPWSCSNIEEIYFDWTLLLSSDPIFTCKNYLGYYTRFNTNNVQDATPLYRSLLDVINISEDNLKNSYPRLKVIGYVSTLQNIMDIVNKNRDTYLDTDDTVWCQNPYIKQAIENPRSLVALHKIKGVPRYNTKFITRSFYRFDEEILKLHFDNVVNAIEKKVRQNQKTIVVNDNKEVETNTGINTENVAKSSYEIALDDTYDLIKADGVYLSLKVMRESLGDKEWLGLFEAMSPQGREKYQTLYKEEKAKSKGR